MKNLIFFLSVIIIVFVSCDNSSKTSKERPENKAPQWYEGGTLHNSTVFEFKQADEKNKLATCADFIRKQGKSMPVEELRSKAAFLKQCIEQSTKGVPAMDHHPVTEVVTACQNATKLN